MTAAGFAHVAKLRQLEYLVFAGDGMDDAGLAHIARYDLIYGLYVGSPRATEAGAQSVSKLGTLR